MTAGLYVHVPFCARRCDYCDFFVVVGAGADARGFFDILDEDLALAADFHAGGGLDTIYFGGGTPSSVEPGSIAAVIDRAGRLMPLAPGAEVTLEANPESVTPERARAWIGAGVNRLSLGVQSFDDAVLPRRGRSYDAAGAAGAVAAARGAGFRNLGIDLIAGLPGESPKGFSRGLQRLIDLSPDHVSVYLLETDDALKDTPLTRAVLEGRERLPSEEATVEMYGAAVDRLTAAGWRHYEISNFARPGFTSRHNLKYWTSDTWLGVGPSAHSHASGRRFGRPADLRRWQERVRSGLFAPAEDDYTLGEPGARAREALVMAMRLIDGVDLAAFARRWQFDPALGLADPIASLEEDGLVARREGRLALTRRGILFANEVFSRLT